MFNWFKKKEKPKANIQLFDLDRQPLKNGDKVHCLRYDIGEAYLRGNPEKEGDYYYESIATGEKTSFLKMIDAHNGSQKVRKLD